jgi:hypothetical protein
MSNLLMTLRLMQWLPSATTPRAALLALPTLLLLAACGGGGGGSTAEPIAAPSPIEAIPVAASQTADGLGAYLTALVQVAADQADTREPLGLGDFAPTTSETAEPMAVVVPGA